MILDTMETYVHSTKLYYIQKYLEEHHRQIMVNQIDNLQDCKLDFFSVEYHYGLCIMITFILN